MRRAVLLAHPAGHSLSPVLHDAAFAACGLEARYEAWDVPPDELAAAVARIREDASVLGANVTVPHKRNVVPLLDGTEEEAAAIGAVNTLRRRGDRLVGDNTDAEGFLRSLAGAGLDPAGRVVVLLGAGGAARAVAWALVRAGAAEVRVSNRTAATAHDLVERLRRRGPAGRSASGAPGVVRVVEDEAALREGVDWWVNATSLGMERGGRAPDETPLPTRPFAASPAPSGGGAPSPGGGGARPQRVAIDLVYRPRRTRFLREAGEAGLTTVDGLGMLLHQGAVAFEAWTGLPAPVEAMRAALERAVTREGED